MENEKPKYRQPKMISFPLGYTAVSADRTGGVSFDMWNNMVTISFYKYGEPMPENRANKLTMGLSHLWYFNNMIAQMTTARTEDHLLIKSGKKPKNTQFRAELPHMVYNKDMDTYQKAGGLYLGQIEHKDKLKVIIGIEKLGASYSVILDRTSLDGNGSIVGLELTINPDDVPLFIMSKLIMSIVGNGTFQYNMANKIATYRSNGGNSYRSGNAGKNYNNRSSYDSADKPKDTGDDIPF